MATEYDKRVAELIEATHKLILVALATGWRDDFPPLNRVQAALIALTTPPKRSKR